jgi:predicted hotdog family 3-hydroxylacyl-ACP dehydratase
MTQLSYPELAKLVPHSGKMSLLDQVVYADAERITVQVKLHQHSMFVQENRIGAWVGVEYMAQAIAAHAGYLAHQQGQAVKIGFLLGSRSYQTDVSYFELGSTLHIHAECALIGENGLGAFICRIEDVSTDRKELAHATITVFQPHNAEDFIEGKTHE